LAYTFPSLCFGREPKVKVVIIQMLITKLEGEDGQVVTTQEEVVASYIRIIIQSNICQECRHFKDKGSKGTFH